MSETPNSVAKNNGEWGENVAEPILKNYFGWVKKINETVDFYDEIMKIPIEVKTCQEFIQRQDKDGELRHGRFTFEKEQHKYLLAQEGYYLFIVRSGDLVLRSRLIKAEDVFTWMSNFKRQLAWVMLA